MHTHRNIFQRQVEDRIVSETITVTITNTQDEITAAILNNSANLITKTFNHYLREKDHYTNQGYSLISDDIQGLTFTVEKTF